MPAVGSANAFLHPASMIAAGRMASNRARMTHRRHRHLPGCAPASPERVVWAAATVPVPEAQPARTLPMVRATAGIGVCMAADGGAAVTSGTLMELLSGRGCLSGVTDAERVCVYLVEGLFPGRPCPAPGPEALRSASSLPPAS